MDDARLRDHLEAHIMRLRLLGVRSLPRPAGTGDSGAVAAHARASGVPAAHATASGVPAAHATASGVPAAGTEAPVGGRSLETSTRIPPLETMAEEVSACRACSIGHTRTRAVFGAGAPDADLVFVGEAPGAEEDRRGLPFVGRAGDLLSKIIEAMGYRREDVFIANILKCRPPNNRDPNPEEIVNCSPYLWRQLDAIRPRVICALGGFAARTLLETDLGISRLRGRFHPLRGYQVMPTYHPAYLLRNPGAKRAVWEDVQKIRDFLATP